MICTISNDKFIASAGCIDHFCICAIMSHQQPHFEEPRFSLDAKVSGSDDPWASKRAIEKHWLLRMPMEFKTGELYEGQYRYVLAHRFILSNHDIDGATDGAGWEPVNMLGEGGFARRGVEEGR